MAMTTVEGSKHHPAGSLAYAAGMVLVYIGQRALASGLTAWVMTGAGVVVVLAALVARLFIVRAAANGDRRGQRALLFLYALGTAALFAYLATSDLVLLTLGTSLERHIPSLNAAFKTLWPALWLLGTLPVLFVEMSYASMRRAPVIEHGRLHTALLSGLGMAFALIFAFATGYSGRLSDIRFDVSYFRTAKAGESTRKIVRNLDQLLTVTAFFPPTNEVAAEVDSYFGGLEGLSPLFKVERYDHALDPGKGRDLGATGNGVIVFTRGTLRRQIGLSLDLDRARQDLRKLDAQVNNLLLAITRPVRRVYFTQGHGERVFSPVDETDRRSTLSRLRQTLLDQGHDVVELTVAHGLGAEVPDDAMAVVVMGPRAAFLPEEAAALHRYVKTRGGSLLVTLDPEAGQAHTNLLQPLGLRFEPVTLANDLAHWRRTGQPSDRTNIATASFGSHVSVATLAKLGFQAPVVFMGAGSLHAIPDAKPAPEVTLQTDGNTWADENLDFEPNTQETRASFALASTVSFPGSSVDSPTGRVLVFADADVFGDIAMQNAGNQMLFADGMHWLGRDENISGAVATEEDVPISHSRKQDVAWFYLTSFVPPALLVALGFVITRRRRAERARDEHVAHASTPELAHKEAV